MTVPLFKVERLALGVGERTLLEGVTAELRAKETVAVHGPSGIGKTTLLRVLAGLIDAQFGSVRLEGKRPAEWGWPRFRRHVVYAAQRPAFTAGTVLDNLARPFAYETSESRFSQESAVDLLAKLGLDAVAGGQEARSLSVGQQQRAALVRAMLVAPKVLLLDEPTSALDAASVEAVEQIVSEWLLRSGAAAFVVTHDEAQATRWCDRVVDLTQYAVEGAAGGAQG